MKVYDIIVPITGNELGDTLIHFTAVWLAWDFATWIFGKQTFSRWVINATRYNKKAALLVFLILVLLPAWLVIHFELHLALEP